MPQLAAIVPYIATAATAYGVVSQVQAGNAAERQGEMLAKQRERDANAAQVEAQQTSIQERKKARFARSRALAVAGKSGAGVGGDPTVSNILTNIDTEGEMNALNTLWSGDVTAQGYRTGARVARAEGRAAKKSAYSSAFSTALNGAGDYLADNPTFFSKYGGQRAKRKMGMGTGYDDFSRMSAGSYA